MATVTETMMAETEETEEKSMTLVETLHQAWIAAGEKMPPKKERERLIRQLGGARENVVGAEKAVLKAQEAVESAGRELVLAIGKKPVRLPDGLTYDPMSRGDKFFYRPRRLSEDVVSID
jgi:hypothetical protein